MPYRRWIVLILLVAAALRLHGLNNLSPPGLSHDEVANWLIDRSILDEDNYAVYYTAAYGHEAGFHFLQAASLRLLGDNALALRLPAAFLGLLLVAVSFALARRLFGVQTALIAAAWLAALFWPVFFSRQGLRAISLPVVSGLSAVFWWRGWTARRWTAFALAGFFAGLSLHTYMAGRAVPIFYGLFLLYLALFHRAELRQRLGGVALFVVVGTAVSFPLFLYLAANPGAEFRIAEVDAPLRALVAGDPRPALTNSLKILAAFGVRGDPLWRHNVAGRPVFTPLIGLFFYAGVGLSLRRFRDSRHAFLFLWLLASVLPSIATIDAPSTIRIVNALPILAIFPALVIHNLGQLSTVIPKLSTEAGKILSFGLLTLLFLFDTGATAWVTFRQWPANDEVQFVWQAALTDTAVFLATHAIDGPAAIGGWTPETMDPPTMAVSLGDAAANLRYFQPATSLIIPGGTADGTSHIFRPAVLPLDPLLEAPLLALGATAESHGTFVHYRLPSPPAPQPPFPVDIRFGEALQFLGFDTHDCASTDSGCQIVTYWRVLARPEQPRRFFLHLVDESGGLVATGDALDAPAAHWQPGDLVLQRHTLPVPPGDGFALRLGVYQPPDGPRLLTPDGRDFVLLTAVSAGQ